MPLPPPWGSDPYGTEERYNSEDIGMGSPTSIDSTMYGVGSGDAAIGFEGNPPANGEYVRHCQVSTLSTTCITVS